MYLALEGMYITLTQHYNVGHIHFWMYLMGWERRCQLLEDQILACFVGLCHKINLHKYSHCQQTGNLKTLVWIHFVTQEQTFYVRIGWCCAVGNPKNLLTAVNCHHVSQSRNSTKKCWTSDQLWKRKAHHPLVLNSLCVVETVEDDLQNCATIHIRVDRATETRFLERAFKHSTKDKVMVEREKCRDNFLPGLLSWRRQLPLLSRYPDPPLPLPEAKIVRMCYPYIQISLRTCSA